MPTKPYFAARAAWFVAVLATATPVGAQFVQPTFVDANSPVERLGGYIRILASNPRNLDALMGAGTAALDVGDANAALGFFSRAEEISPSSARAKAGLGAALANIEKPDDALRLFAQAASLGARESEFARDRGLAYDLTGDWRRAQRDYALALQIKADDETTRRLALSLGISGDRARALQVLDPLLRRQDQGAWRARSFIYAMTGDVGQANTVARQLMPAPMAASMSPLLTRLATLNAAERAHAVNFGTVPSDGTRLASADTSRPLPPAPTTISATARAAPTLAGALAERAIGPGIGPGPGPDAGTGRTPSSGLIPAGEPLGRRGGAASVSARPPVELAVRDASPAPSVVAAPTPAPVTPVVRRIPRYDPFDGSPFGAASVRQRTPPRIVPVDPARLPPEARGEASAVLVPSGALPPPSSTTAPATIPTARADAALRGTTQVTVRPETALPPRSGAVTAPPVQQGLPVGPGTSMTGLATTTMPSSLPSPLPSSVGQGPVGQAAAPTSQVIGPPIDPAAAPVAAPAATNVVASAVLTPAFETPTPGFSPQATPVVALPSPVGGASAPALLPKPTRPAVAGARLAGLLTGLTTEEESPAVELPSAREQRLGAIEAKRKSVEQASLAVAKAEAERAASARVAKEAEDARRNPARLWVQLATGADERALPFTWRQVRAANAAALEGLEAHSVPFKATNRLLVGPLKSAAAARDLIRALARNDLIATTYSSAVGEEVARVAGK